MLSNSFGNPSVSDTSLLMLLAPQMQQQQLALEDAKDHVVAFVNSTGRMRRLHAQDKAENASAAARSAVPGGGVVTRTVALPNAQVSAGTLRQHTTAFLACVHAAEIEMGQYQQRLSDQMWSLHEQQQQQRASSPSASSTQGNCGSFARSTRRGSLTWRSIQQDHADRQQQTTSASRAASPLVTNSTGAAAATSGSLLGSTNSLGNSSALSLHIPDMLQQDRPRSRNLSPINVDAAQQCGAGVPSAFSSPRAASPTGSVNGAAPALTPLLIPNSAPCLTINAGLRQAAARHAAGALFHALAIAATFDVDLAIPVSGAAAAAPPQASVAATEEESAPVASSAAADQEERPKHAHVQLAPAQHDDDHPAMGESGTSLGAFVESFTTLPGGIGVEAGVPRTFCSASSQPHGGDRSHHHISVSQTGSSATSAAASRTTYPSLVAGEERASTAGAAAGGGSAAEVRAMQLPPTPMNQVQQRATVSNSGGGGGVITLMPVDTTPPRINRLGSFGRISRNRSAQSLAQSDNSSGQSSTTGVPAGGASRTASGSGIFSTESSAVMKSPNGAGDSGSSGSARATGGGSVSAAAPSSATTSGATTSVGSGGSRPRVGSAFPPPISPTGSVASGTATNVNNPLKDKVLLQQALRQQQRQRAQAQSALFRSLGHVNPERREAQLRRHLSYMHQQRQQQRAGRAASMRSTRGLVSTGSGTKLGAPAAAAATTATAGASVTELGAEISNVSGDTAAPFVDILLGDPAGSTAPPSRRVSLLPPSELLAAAASSVTSIQSALDVISTLGIRRRSSVQPAAAVAAAISFAAAAPDSTAALPVEASVPPVADSSSSQRDAAPNPRLADVFQRPLAALKAAGQCIGALALEEGGGGSSKGGFLSLLGATRPAQHQQQKPVPAPKDSNAAFFALLGVSKSSQQQPPVSDGFVAASFAVPRNAFTTTTTVGGASSSSGVYVAAEQPQQQQRQRPIFGLALSQPDSHDELDFAHAESEGGATPPVEPMAQSVTSFLGNDATFAMSQSGFMPPHLHQQLSSSQHQHQHHYHHHHNYQQVSPFFQTSLPNVPSAAALSDWAEAVESQYGGDGTSATQSPHSFVAHQHSSMGGSGMFPPPVAGHAAASAPPVALKRRGSASLPQQQQQQQQLLYQLGATAASSGRGSGNAAASRSPSRPNSGVHSRDASTLQTPPGFSESPERPPFAPARPFDAQPPPLPAMFTVAAPQTASRRASNETDSGAPPLPLAHTPRQQQQQQQRSVPFSSSGAASDAGSSQLLGSHQWDGATCAPLNASGVSRMADASLDASFELRQSQQLNATQPLAEIPADAVAAAQQPHPAVSLENSSSLLPPPPRRMNTSCGSSGLDGLRAAHATAHDDSGHQQQQALDSAAAGGDNTSGEYNNSTSSGGDEDRGDRAGGQPQPRRADSEQRGGESDSSSIESGRFALPPSVHQSRQASPSGSVSLPRSLVQRQQETADESAQPSRSFPEFPVVESSE